MPPRRGFTKIELLVTISVIGCLIAILAPAVMRLREIACQVQCKNNLKQIALAVHNYISDFQKLPPTLCLDTTRVANVNSGWSVQGRLLPYLDQMAAYQKINPDVSWEDPVNQASGIPQFHIPTYSCPSDPLSQNIFYAGPYGGYVFPCNYAVNCGTWLVYDPLTNSGGDGCYYPNASLGLQSITDGLSSTMCAAEVKTYQSYLRHTDNPGPVPFSDPANVALYAQNAIMKVGPAPDQNTGHTNWCDGRSIETGFTTVFSPNTYVGLVFNGLQYDVDYASRNETPGGTERTYSAVTARSYHQGIVYVVMMDGSVRGVREVIGLSLWRALGTRAEISD